jgi:Mg-chelatase subunit ChlD
MSADLSSLHRLAAEHPALQPLRQRAWGRALLEGAAPLALHLAGAPEQPAHWLVDLLRLIAADELAWMRQTCRGSALRAGAAAVAILTHLARQAPDDDDAAPDDDAPDQGGDPGGDGGDALSRLLGGPSPPGAPRLALPPEGEEQRDDQLGAALADALRVPEMGFDAMDALARQGRLMEQLHQMMPGMGWGHSAEGLEQRMQGQWDRIAALLARSGALQRVIDELGRAERAARARRPDLGGGREEITGVHFGGELTEALPCELALLGDEDTELLFYQRVIERRLLSLEIDGALADPRPQGRDRGPVVACVDTSGSMQGAPEAIAKALILTVLRRTLPQRRPVHLILFGGPGQRQEIDLRRPGPQAIDALLGFLALSFQAGTDFDGPLLRAMELMEDPTYEDADVLVVTDGLCEAREEVRAAVEAARAARRFRVVSVVIGGDARAVARFSDEVWRVSPDEALPEGLTLRAWGPPPPGVSTPGTSPTA